VARLYADENVPARVIARLRKLGHDVLTALEDGRANKSIDDEIVLERSIQLARCVLTNNRKHFHRLHKIHHDHFGILTFTTDIDANALAERIDTGLGANDELEGRLIRVVKPKT